jgi:glyoxylase-like metal-dependent hydrolase (beta-lactamase superfamily II)
MRVVPNVHKFVIHIGSVNIYLITDGDEMTMIDAGFAQSTPYILSRIKRLGFKPTDLKHILITHADIDHAGGITRLKEATGAKVYAGKVAADALAEGVSSREIHTDPVGKRVYKKVEDLAFPQGEVDVVLEPDQVLPVLGGLRAVPTPGHTPCHYSYFLEDEQVLFTGDSLRTLGWRATINNFKFLIWDRGEMRRSMERQHALKPRYVCPGHGPTLKNAHKKFPIK